MSSIESVMFQLTSGLVNETSIPTNYLYNSEIIAAIQTYKWSLGVSENGWTKLIKYINYSS